MILFKTGLANLMSYINFLNIAITNLTAGSYQQMCFFLNIFQIDPLST